ncbi:short-chain dehydrogenase [Marinithermofilum abyssi]|uniref:Short-chain dehydrogenase n=1 Tax=Marinithermofilum abyssi TaxID=1571185 RepID=A0A8J2VIC7_9BACL|nr:SDR family oxidoreductase [Marinithermofilum abyssi]GGE19493.1 short-chain dehydrogenase [Marinithermofilum abyssi]
MNLGLQGKVALVTASSRGLGKAIAMELAREGSRVAICSRSRDRVEETAAAIRRRTNAEILALTGDVSQGDDISRIVEQTITQWGRIDILVCNAGGPPSGPFESFDDVAWMRAFETNLLSVVRLVRAALPHMDRGGRILTIASSSVKQPIPGLILSNTMRAGVNGLMKTLAEELAPRGILVNTICPGRIATGRLQELDQAAAEREGISPDAVQDRVVRQIPLGRYGEPEEFARVAAFLASDANSYVTGATLLVDGGMVKAL